ncbi:MAG: hypothetical protein CVV64_03575 [Candidatus Wallbacteria bacterium HGW-Wallbacteria-1]|jgi:lipopolysaccharide/colanic/teichoic acid biosynthesis glycosyltransferase|uniref:Bacterial sugar transferase domain-containing protein n=1 Tax=Candidatus Wallbacteria bacterium HGW-Wallbacteria-1 TaxID=2013854 RepID=A0A2N1PTS7_9BACT|nr:MAG: hypothetical protein CVV64_03575 [Candidatus Wallbacteria bacterium HGW-Wallbacteria-1]
MKTGFTMAGLTAIADIIVMVLSFFGAFHLRNLLALHPAHHGVLLEDYEAFLIYVVLIWLVFLKTCGAYGLYGRSGQEDIARPVAAASLNSTTVMMAATFLIKDYDLSRMIFLLFAAMTCMWLLLIRIIFRRVFGAMRKRGTGLVNCLLVGCPADVERVSQRLLNPVFGLCPLGLVLPMKSEAAGMESGSVPADLQPHSSSITGPMAIPGTSATSLIPTVSGDFVELSIESIPVLGTVDGLRGLIGQTGAEEVVFLPGAVETQELFSLRSTIASTGVAMSIIPDPESMVPTATDIKFFDGLMAIEVLPGRDRGPYRLVKRFFDMIFALGVLILTAPLMLLVAFAIRILDGSPVLFRQRRIGKCGREFTIYKFRTMQTQADAYETSPRNRQDPRLTGLGRLLRRFCLDEMPQFMNVLLGDMSVVGPRPEMPFIVDGYDELARRRLEVLPGITGMWQVYGRERMAFIHEDIKFDIYYVENQSLLLDLEIILATIPVMFLGKGSV